LLFGGVGIRVYPPENSGIMASKPKSTGKAEGNLEIAPDAWERFERAVDVVIKSGPKHRQKSDAEACPSKPKIARHRNRQ
jgi:hypothetical protein